MPKTKRSEAEIQSVKDEILKHASELIDEQGFRGFSMRKLASRLGITAKTIYNYYQSKDELYLTILTQGFNHLTALCLQAEKSRPQPVDQLRAMILAYLDFGLTNPHLYNLMFTWAVPKFNDYLGTAMEPTARIELEAALHPPLLFIKTIMACAALQHPGKKLSDDDARVIMILLWTQVHGYVAGINNTLLDYMHAEPLGLISALLEEALNTVHRQIDIKLGDDRIDRRSPDGL